MTELRQHRLALGKLLAQLALPDPEGEQLRTPMQARAQRAAQSLGGFAVARRRPIAPPEGGEQILPRELADYTGTTAADYADFWRAQKRWMADHGIPWDWPIRRALVQRSRAAYRLPDRSALARARLRVTQQEGGGD